MRKTILIVLSIAILAAAGTGAFIYLRRGGMTAEDLLPEGSLFYLQARDAASQWNQLTATRFFQGLQDIDYTPLLEESNLTARQRETIRSVFDKFNDPMLELLVKRFFGKECVLAVYPPEPASGPRGLVDILSVLSNATLVTRLQGEAPFIEFIGNVWGRSQTSFETETFDYEGQTIRVVTLPQTGLKVGFVRIGDFLVIGLGDRAARRSVDIYRGHQPSLKKDKSFMSVQENFSETAGLSAYVNVRKFIAFLKSEVKTLSGTLAAQAKEAGGQTEKDFQNQITQTTAAWDDLGRQTDGMEALGVSAGWAGGLRLKAALHFDPSRLDPSMAPLWRCPGQRNATLSFVPEDVLAYQWGNCVDLGYYWKEFQKEISRVAQKTQKQANPLTNMTQVMGLNVATQILPIFGQEMGGYLQDIKTGAAFPIPQLLFFVEIKDAVKAEELLAKLTDMPFAVVQTENYAGTTIHYLVSPLGQDVEPAYCFWDKYLLIAVNPGLIHHSIDIVRNHLPSIVDSPEFKQLDLSAQEKMRGLQLLKLDKIVESLSGIVTWSQNWVAGKDAKQQAFKSGSEQKLADVEKDISTAEAALKESKQQTASLEDVVWDLNSRGEDTSGQQTQINELKDKVKTLDGQISADKERRADLKKVIKGYEAYFLQRQRQRELYQKVIEPLIKNFAFIRTAGSHSAVKGTVFETKMFLKIE